MQTSVLGVRLNSIQMGRLKEIAAENKMKEVEVARLLIDSVIQGKIKVEKGRVIVGG